MSITASLDDVAKIIGESKKALILPHVSADGDAVGSSLALLLALRRAGLEAEVCMEEDIPLVYEFLPGTGDARVCSPDIPSCIAQADFDIAIALDAGDINRLGKRAGLFNAARVTVNIDHHSTNTMFAMYNYVDVKASAVGEIIYGLIKKLGVHIGRDIAECLYVAIATDTGGFRFSNTVPETHLIAAELIKCGIDVASISRRIFDTASFEKIKLMGEAINSISIFEDGKAAMIVLTDEKIARTGAVDEDFDGIVDIAGKIRGVEVAVLLRTQPDGSVKANLRSKEKVDVAAIASSFGGGGHVRAAGFTTKMPLEEVIKNLREQIALSLK